MKSVWVRALTPDPGLLLHANALRVRRPDDGRGADEGRGAQAAPRDRLPALLQPVLVPALRPVPDPYYHPRAVVVDPIAYARERGYHEGKDEGGEDDEKGRPANPQGHEDYLKSNSVAFRGAFLQGYEEGYREELAETTREMREKGRSKGREDARKGRPADPSAHKDYLKATSRAYRDAFAQGYNELYRAQSAGRHDRDGD